jgi:hypothetical protein
MLCPRPFVNLILAFEGEFYPPSERKHGGDYGDLDPNKAGKSGQKQA